LLGLLLEKAPKQTIFYYALLTSLIKITANAITDGD